MSRVDWFYRRLIVTSIFTKGWGNPENMKRIMNFRKLLAQREICQSLVPADYPVYIDKEEKEKDCRLVEGHFLSPVVNSLPGVMPKEVEIARFQMVLPNEWKTDLKPICLHLGGTGDHGFRRRRQAIARPLLQEEGIASIILENPYYGTRKPKAQFRSSLHHVSDLFVMGAGIIMESLVIFHFLDRLGYGPLGTTGISMGGHMASLAATNWHKPLSLVPCMSWSTASGVFTHGVLSTAIPWKVLEEQFLEEGAYQAEIMDLIQSPEPYWKSPMYKEGQMFAKILEESPSVESSVQPDYNIVFNKYLEHSPLHLLNKSFNGINSGSKPDNTETFESVENFIDQSVGKQTKSDDSDPQTVDSSNGDKSDQDFTSLFTESSEDADNQVIDKPGDKEPKVEVSDSGESTVTVPAVCDKPQSGVPRWRYNLMASIAKLQSLYKSSNSESKVSSKQLQEDSRFFMRGVMDECTHLGNFAVPIDPELIIIVTAENDAYIPRHDVLKLDELWPGSQQRLLPRGHISGYLFEKKEFRKAIGDSFRMQIDKYYPEHSQRKEQESYTKFLPDSQQQHEQFASSK